MACLSTGKSQMLRRRLELPCVHLRCAEAVVWVCFQINLQSSSCCAGVPDLTSKRAPRLVVGVLRRVPYKGTTRQERSDLPRGDWVKLIEPVPWCWSEFLFICCLPELEN
uniref:(northern house mosquito) hypothetical protein n=1 Tax=Culex pipiens TaxID=7175 RepID=A0A8D8N0A6_CULPI